MTAGTHVRTAPKGQVYVGPGRALHGLLPACEKGPAPNRGHLAEDDSRGSIQLQVRQTKRKVSPPLEQRVLVPQSDVETGEFGAGGKTCLHPKPQLVRRPFSTVERLETAADRGVRRVIGGRPARPAVEDRSHPGLLSGNDQVGAVHGEFQGTLRNLPTEPGVQRNVLIPRRIQFQTPPVGSQNRRRQVGADSRRGQVSAEGRNHGAEFLRQPQAGRVAAAKARRRQGLGRKQIVEQRVRRWQNRTMHSHLVKREFHLTRKVPHSGEPQLQMPRPLPDHGAGRNTLDKNSRSLLGRLAQGRSHHLQRAHIKARGSRSLGESAGYRVKHLAPQRTQTGKRRTLRKGLSGPRHQGRQIMVGKARLELGQEGENVAKDQRPVEGKLHSRNHGSSIGRIRSHARRESQMGTTTLRNRRRQGLVLEHGQRIIARA